MTLTRSLSMAGSGSAQGSPVRPSRTRGSTFGEGGAVVSPPESLLTRQLSSRERQREHSNATIVSTAPRHASLDSSSETGLESSSGRASSPTPPTPPECELPMPPSKPAFALGADGAEDDAEPRSWGDGDAESEHLSRTPAMHTRSPSAVPNRILPDELVMVGLDMDHEAIWRCKLEDLLFYPQDHLVPQSDLQRGRSIASSFQSLDSIAEMARADPFGSTPTPDATHMRASRAAVHNASSVPTRHAGAPTPFVSFTSTATDASLIADIRLLRLLFTGREETDESDGTILAVGEGGLRGEWIGEMADVDTDDFDADDEDASSSDEALDRSASSLGISAGRRRGRRRQGNAAYASALSPASASSSSRSPVVDSSRKLLKCLQLDLSEIEIDHSGSVFKVANALLSQNVNLLYSSTLLTANALIGKADLGASVRRDPSDASSQRPRCAQRSRALTSSLSCHVHRHPRACACVSRSDPLACAVGLAISMSTEADCHLACWSGPCLSNTAAAVVALCSSVPSHRTASACLPVLSCPSFDDPHAPLPDLTTSHDARCHRSGRPGCGCLGCPSVVPSLGRRALRAPARRWRQRQPRPAARRLRPRPGPSLASPALA